MTEVATGYVTVLPSARGFGSSLQRQIGGGMSRAGTAAGRTYATGMQRGVASRARSVFAPLLGVGAALALGRVIKDSVLLEATFSKTMAQVAVATRAPKSELQELDDLAIQLGASTVFSANESAAAMLSLAKGGLNPAQIQAGALNNTLTLAAAGELDLATAADTVVKAMGAFELGAKDSKTAVAALAGAANASSASVSDITQSLASVGTEAHASGLSVQETTGILAAFADSGFQGSDAGTALRTMLTRLVPQTDKARSKMKDLGLSFVDAQGQFVGAEQIADRLQRTFQGMSDAERTSALTTIFGADARRAANVLINQGADGLRKYIKQTSDLNQAEKLAKASMSGTAGALEQLDGAVETAQLQIGKGLAPTIEDAADATSAWLEDADVEQWTRDAVGGIKAFGSELKPLATDVLAIGRDALPVFIQAGGTAVALLETAADVVRPLVSGFSALPGPIQQVALAMGAAAAVAPRLNRAISSGAASAGSARAKVAQFGAELTYTATRGQALMGLARNLAGPAGIVAIGATAASANPAVEALGTAAGGALIGFSAGGPIGAAIGAGIGGLVGLAGAFGDTGDAAEAAKPPISDYTSTLNELTGAATSATRAAVAKDLADQGILTTARDLGIASGDVTSAILGNKGALDRVYAATTRQAKTEEGLTDAHHALIDAVGVNSRRAFQEQVNAQRLVAEETRGVTVDVKAYNSVLREVPPQVRTAIEQLGMDTSRADVKALGKQYDLTPKTVRTLMEALGFDAAIDKARGLNGELDRLDGRNVVNTVTTIFTSTQGGHVVPNADGNIWRNNRIQRFANGAERHIAQIGRPGAVRVWNEEEAGGESYIPLARSKRRRSLEIWARTGHLLGVPGFADGDITNPPKPLADSVIRDVLAQLKETFGKQSPIVDAISGWLDGLKRGELSQKALTKRLELAMSRQIDPALRQFGVTGRQSRSETKGEVGELLRTLRDTFGRSSPVVAAVDRLGGKLLEVQQRQDRLVDRHDAAASKLDTIIQNQRAYTNEVRQAFTHEAFEGSASELRIQLRADANDARRATRQLRTLQRKGLDGGLFKQLAASGNTALIAQLSRMTPKQIAAFERDFRNRNRATGTLGRLAGREVFGDRRQNQAQAVAELRKEIKDLNKVIEKFGNRVEDRVEKGAFKGVKAGIDGKQQKQQRGRRSGAGVR